jgi:glucose/arabinose dehydrogenase
MKKSLLTLALLPLLAQAQSVKTEVVAEGLVRPWSMAALPGGAWLVTEKAGQLHHIDAAGKLSAPIVGVPQVDDAGQGGLHDVVLDSGFAANRQLYLCYAEPGEKGAAGTALARARLSADGRSLEQVQVIFSQKPKMNARQHFGCRIVEARDGTLFLSLGDRGRGMQSAQTLDNHIGKVVRITKDGKAPADNPLVGKAGALPEIWSYGHRNQQGALLDANGQLWTHEHGPQGGDEINRPQAGKNYGWPVITYGENYGGGKIGEGLTQKDGMEQPLVKWVPSIAPSGFAQLTSKAYGEAWVGSFFIGSLKFRHLERVKLDAGGKVVAQERLLADIGRVRDVRQGPDGLIYVLTESEPAQLLRLLPKP